MSSEVLHLRINKAEGEMLKKTADSLGISRSELIRKVVYSIARLDGIFWESLQNVSEQTGLNDTAVLEALVFDCISDLTFGAAHLTPGMPEAKIKHINWINSTITIGRRYGTPPTAAIGKAKAKRTQ